MVERKFIGEYKIICGVINGIPWDEDLDELKRNIFGDLVKDLQRLTK